MQLPNQFMRIQDRLNSVTLRRNLWFDPPPGSATDCRPPFAKFVTKKKGGARRRRLFLEPEIGQFWTPSGYAMNWPFSKTMSALKSVVGPVSEPAELSLPYETTWYA